MNKHPYSLEEIKVVLLEVITLLDRFDCDDSRRDEEIIKYVINHLESWYANVECKSQGQSPSEVA